MSVDNRIKAKVRLAGLPENNEDKLIAAKDAIEKMSTIIREKDKEIFNLLGKIGRIRAVAEAEIAPRSYSDGFREGAREKDGILNSEARKYSVAFADVYADRQVAKSIVDQIKGIIDRIITIEEEKVHINYSAQDIQQMCALVGELSECLTLNRHAFGP